MFRPEAYPVEVDERCPPGYTLPVHAVPADDEALASWLRRLATMAGLSAFAFTRKAFGICSSARPEWWRRPPPGHREILMERGGLTPEQLAAMTLEGWSIARNDERDERFSAGAVQYPKRRFKAGRSLPVCGRCLAEDAKPYLRRDWLIGWIAVCPRHRTVLTRTCPGCERKLISRGLGERDLIDLQRCPKCETLLTGAEAQPAIDAAIELQTAMLALKRRGAGTIKGLGLIDWKAFTVILDLVLKVIWSEAKVNVREELFALILADLALDPDRRLRIDWRRNYGVLVVMAWMLADWPDRLLQTLALLNAPRIEDIVAELNDVDDATRKRVLDVVGSANDHRPKPESWKVWLADLVAEGTDFRALADEDTSWVRRDRLIAVALLSEGRTIAEAAAAVRVSTNMIERWLEIGMAYGLPAVTAKALRICDITPDQKAEIAAWLREADRTHSGPTGWTREHARSEITARFGLLITTNAAYHFLLDNRPRPKRL